MDNVAYDINSIVDSTFFIDTLDEYPELKEEILALKNPSLEKINVVKNHLKRLKLSKETKHHIKIRLELLEYLLT